MNIPPLAQCDPSDSLTQREVETAMLQRLTEDHPDWLRVDWVTIARDLALPLVWQKAKPDAVWKVVGDGSHRDGVIICECYARIGQLKAGHRRKLAMDAFKLIALKHHLPSESQARIRWLLAVPQELHAQLQGGGWFTEALRMFEVMPVTLTEIERRKLCEATDRQAEGQTRRAKTKKGRIA